MLRETLTYMPAAEFVAWIGFVRLENCVAATYADEVISRRNRMSMIL